MNLEVDTQYLIKYLYDQSNQTQNLFSFLLSFASSSKEKICYIPCVDRGKMFMKQVVSYLDYCNLPMNSWGIKESRFKTMDELSPDLELILVPGWFL